MKKISISVAKLANGLLLFLPLAGSAETDIRWVMGASFGYSQFEFKEKLDHEVSFPTANFLVAATVDAWQISVNSTFTLTDADVSEEEERGKASRSDIDITIGRQVVDNWSLFAGYKRGDTDVTFISREAEDEGIIEATEENYEFSGPYIGLSHSWRFEKAGSLSLTVAYAFLSADNVFAANVDDSDEEDELEFDDISGRNKGDLEGLSYALSWTMPLSGQLLFQTKFKIIDYQMDITFDDQLFKGIDQNFSSLQVGLAYVF
jgi:hypothetical protein